MIRLLWPALHAGGLGWDEYLLILAGALALIVIAVAGGRPDHEEASAGKAPRPGRRKP